MKKSIRFRARNFTRVSVPVLSLVMGAFAHPSARAEDAPIVITSTRIALKEQDAPYAVEVHTSADIANSGAVTLYDYLAKFTSLQIASGFGNNDAPLIGMRGYGLENGYQNMVIALNGERLNSIDMSQPVLGVIPLADIDRIEITKGVGSTLFGDGAMAGTLQIITKPIDGGRIQAYGGSNGAQGWSGHAGKKLENFQVGALVDGRQFGGFVNRDANGQTDSSKANNWLIDTSWQGDKNLKLKSYIGQAESDVRYNYYLTESQWRANPSLNTGITHQKYNTDKWGVLAEIPLYMSVLKFSYHDERKASDSTYPSGWSSASSYGKQLGEVSLNGQNQGVRWIAGAQFSEGWRSGTDNKTRKNNESLFVQVHKDWGALNWMVGVRSETVSYSYQPTGGAAITKDHNLPQWETGLNYAQSDNMSIFGSFSKAYQAPDIDRFFTCVWSGLNCVGQTFNGLIQPAQVETWTLGLNHKTASNKLKIAAFRANLRDEIYYDQAGLVANTNIDRSHKYGLEAQDQFTISSQLVARLNYTYTIAVMDSTASSSPSYSGKTLPGVSRDIFVLGLAWKPAPSHAVNLSQVWRSQAYAFNDFANIGPQKQPAYRSTDLSYRYALTKTTNLFASVNNLFDKNNAILSDQNHYYAIDYSRTWRVGFQTSL